MGASSSVDFSTEEVDELVLLTKFSPKEIKTLYKRFRRLDRTGRGTISTDDLTMIPEVCMSPLAPRICEVLFEFDGDGRVNFASFAKGLAFFNRKAPTEVKMEGLFRFFDFDNDNYISADDLRALLKLMIGESMSPEAIERVIHETLKASDFDGDGLISPTDFVESTKYYPWSSFFVPIKGSS